VSSLSTTDRREPPSRRDAPSTNYRYGIFDEDRYFDVFGVCQSSPEDLAFALKRSTAAPRQPGSYSPPSLGFATHGLGPSRKRATISCGQQGAGLSYSKQRQRSEPPPNLLVEYRLGRHLLYGQEGRAPIYQQRVKLKRISGIMRKTRRCMSKTPSTVTLSTGKPA